MSERSRTRSMISRQRLCRSLAYPLHHGRGYARHWRLPHCTERQHLQFLLACVGRRGSTSWGDSAINGGGDNQIVHIFQFLTLYNCLHCKYKKLKSCPQKMVTKWILSHKSHIRHCYAWCAYNTVYMSIHIDFMIVICLINTGYSVKQHAIPVVIR